MFLWKWNCLVSVCMGDIQEHQHGGLYPITHIAVQAKKRALQV